MASRPSKRRRNEQRDNEEEEETGEAHSTRNISASPLVVFAHGAGAPSTSDWMIRWKELLQNALDAVEVVTFDYPYISGGKRKAPPKAEKLVGYHSDIVRRAIEKHPGHPLILVGKSMGSRVSCMVAAQDDMHPCAIVCLGYPLKQIQTLGNRSCSSVPICGRAVSLQGLDTLEEMRACAFNGVNGAVRDEILLQLSSVRVMFVQGSKDALCPLDRLDDVQMKMTCYSMLHVIDGGDHSFKIGKKLLQSKASSQAEAEEQAVKAIADFISKSIATVS